MTAAPDIWETDVNLDYQPAEITGDNVAVNWELDSNDDIMPLAAPLNAPGTPTLEHITPIAGGFTINVTAASPTDTIYAVVRLAVPANPWYPESATFSRVGSGNITYTGLSDRWYDVAVYAKSADLTSAWSGTSRGMPDGDPLATSRQAIRLQTRDQVALDMLQLAKAYGIKAIFYNDPGTSGYTIYAVVSGDSGKRLDVKRGQIDHSFLSISVPRQTNFPPAEFRCNSSVEINGKRSQVESLTYQGEEIDQATSFDLQLGVIADQYQY